jgi:superfamily II DNA or RNA helicase
MTAPSLPSVEPAEITRSFGLQSTERGKSYAASGRVSKLRYVEADNRVEAEVSGSQPLPYRVDLRLLRTSTGRHLYGLCSCPMRVNCKHAAAVAFVLADAQARQSAALRSPVPALVSEVGIADTPPGLSRWLERLARAAEPQPEEPDEYPPNAVQRLLYLLDAADGRPRVSLALARPLKSGGYSEPRAWDNARAALASPPSFVLRADLAILRRLLLDAPFDVRIDFPPAAEDALALLRLMLATGRCHWRTAELPALREAGPRTAAAAWRADDAGVQRLALETQPPSSAVLPLQPPWYIDLRTSECGPVATALPAPLAAALASAPTVPPHQARAVRERLAQAGVPDLPLPQVPEETEVSGEPPVPVLRLFTLEVWPTRRYRNRPLGDYLDLATLRFDYGGVLVGRDEPATISAFRHGKLARIHRDLRSEKRFQDMVTGAGLVKLMSAHSHYPAEYKHAFTLVDETRWLDFVGRTVPRLRAEGWRVEMDESFRFNLAQVGEWFADVAESGSDWFDLTLGVEVDGERRNLLPILLAALRAWPGMLEPDAQAPDDASVIVVLEDGRLMPVPVARVRPLLAILNELADAGIAPKLRLPRLDAARLANLERDGGLRFAGAEPLREFGARLAGFTGIEAVAPPAGLQAKLRGYQADGLAWLQFLRSYDLGGILADDMGLGKTLQALAHILVEKEAGRLDRPALVVAPTSVIPNWASEAARFAPSLRVHVSHGLKRKESFDRIAEHDLVLTTYPLLARDKDALTTQKFHLVILDEAQQIKNAQTQGARVVTQLDARHRLCLTGTPLENHLGELWSLFHFLMPGFLGDAEAFRKLYRTPIEKRGDEPRRTSLARRIRPFVLRRTKEQVATELPPKTEIVERITLTGAQADLYETVRASMHARVRAEIAARGLNQSQIIVLDALLKLRQICCDPRLLKLEAARKVKGSAKLERLLEVLDELLAEGRRVLLFSQFTSMLELIEGELKARKVAYLKLTGETRERKKPVDQFQSGEVPLFLISLKAGGTGLNLTAADTVIHYDPWWNPAVENQATDRAHRIGQDKPVFVYKLIVAGSVEEKIAQLQATKAALAAGILGEGGAAGAPLSQEDIAALFEPIG